MLNNTERIAVPCSPNRSNELDPIPGLHGKAGYPEDVELVGLVINPDRPSPNRDLDALPGHELPELSGSELHARSKFRQLGVDDGLDYVVHPT